jgi:hypothetical protein
MRSSPTSINLLDPRHANPKQPLNCAIGAAASVRPHFRNKS